MPVLTYKEFIQKIRNFSRSSVLEISSRLAWSAWNRPKEVREERYFQNSLYMYRAYCGRIAAIAAAVCNDFRSTDVTNYDIEKLCQSYLSIQEPILNEINYQQTDVLPLQSYLAGSELFHDILIDIGLIDFCARLLTPIRHLQSQHDSSLSSDSIHTTIRNYAILLQYLKLRDEGFNNTYLMRLGIEPSNILKIGLLIIAGAEKKSGLIVIGENILSNNIKRQTGLDYDALLVMANRFSRDFNGFRSWHEMVLRMNPLLSKYVPHPLLETPLIKMASNKFALPSPWHLMEKIKYSLWEPITQQDQMDLIGTAFKNYFDKAIRIILPNALVIDLDQLKCLKGKKRGDYLLHQSGRGLIVELKRSVGSYSGSAISEPKDVVEFCERIGSALMQCGHTLKYMNDVERELNIKIEKVGTLICLLEEFVPSSVFYALYFNTELHRKCGVEQFELVSIDQFECLLMDVGFENVFDALTRNEKGETTGLIGIKPMRKSIYKDRKEKSSTQMAWHHLDQFKKELLPSEDTTTI